MNCAECRDNLVAYAEGLLEAEELLRCKAHLEGCAACRRESTAIASLQQRLLARGQAAAEATLVEPVMRRVLRKPRKLETISIMSTLLKHRWGFGLGTAAVAAAILFIALLSTPKTQAAALEVMARGAKAAARLSSIHLRGRLRTAPKDNFSAIRPERDFTSIELWKQFEPQLKWRAEKAGRVAAMDGKTTLLFIKPDYAYKFDQPSPDAFDTQWLQEMADLNRTLNQELKAIKFHGWPVTVAAQPGADGRSKSVVTVEAKSGFLTGDYLKNKFFETADTRRVYVFDNETELLEGVQIYLHADSGDKLIFELDQIECNPALEPSLFELQLPANVVWEKPMEVLPDNEKYAAMTPEQAARAFFEACSREDWAEAGKFCTMTGGLKGYLAGLQVVSIGKPFTSAISLLNGAQFVPYEIKLKGGELKKFNLALKRDGHTRRWFVDGGI